MPLSCELRTLFQVDVDMALRRRNMLQMILGRTYKAREPTIIMCISSAL